MSINSINSKLSFGALMVDKNEYLKRDKAIVSKIISSPELPTQFIKDLEKVNTDVYVVPNEDGNANIKLCTSAGLTYNFTPRTLTKEDGAMIEEPLEESFNETESKDTINYRIANFVARAKGIMSDFYSVPRNVHEREYYEEASMSDMMGKNPRDIKYPQNLPNGICIFGSPQVTTKAFLNRVI